MVFLWDCWTSTRGHVHTNLHVGVCKMKEICWPAKILGGKMRTEDVPWDKFSNAWQNHSHINIKIRHYGAVDDGRGSANKCCKLIWLRPPKWYKLGLEASLASLIVSPHSLCCMMRCRKNRHGCAEFHCLVFPGVVHSTESTRSSVRPDLGNLGRMYLCVCLRVFLLRRVAESVLIPF